MTVSLLSRNNTIMIHTNRKLMIIFFIIFITVVVALLPHIVFVAAKLLSLVFHFHVSYAPYGHAALYMVLLWLVLFSWGHFFGRYFYQVKHVDIACEGLPASFDGYKIVHISDLHLDGWKGHEDKLQEIIDSVNAQDADAVVFTGDIVSLSKDELKPFVTQLRQLKARDGVFSIMGNHDYMPYNRRVPQRQRDADVKELQRMEREDMGWDLLLNESRILHRGSDSIAIVGSENQDSGVHVVIRRGDLAKALQGTDGLFHLILTHNPMHWKEEIVRNPMLRNGSLTLCGHTHAGQVRIFGLSVAAFIYKEYDGLYTEAMHKLYVNIGLGGTMPMRIGATPEVTAMKLKSQSSGR